MLISVIIPTYRRPELCRRAVKSVLMQTHQELEVLVVIDGVDDGTRAAIELLDDGRVTVLETGMTRGPAMARNTGVEAASGAYVALLDDDDEWIATKLAEQIHLIDRHGLHGQEFLVSCRTITKCHRTGRAQEWPKVLYDGGDISDYLFDRRYPWSRSGLVASGTLLFPRKVALRIPFPDDEAHEDWSWLLLCVGKDRIPLYMSPQPLFIYNINYQPSRNVLADWEKSLDWARRYRGLLTATAFAGLLATTTAWRAKRQSGMANAITLARVMQREGRPRITHWLTLAAVMLSPVGMAEKLRHYRDGLLSRRLALPPKEGGAHNDFLPPLAVGTVESDHV